MFVDFVVDKRQFGVTRGIVTHPGQEVKRSPQAIRFEINDISPEAELLQRSREMGFHEGIRFLYCLPTASTA